MSHLEVNVLINNSISETPGYVFHVPSFAVLPEFMSLSVPVTWEENHWPGGLCPHTTVNNVSRLLAYHADPDSDLSLIATDLGHRSVSGEVI